jgi:hypothetical protein
MAMIMTKLYKLGKMFGILMVLIFSICPAHADYIATFVPHLQLLPQHLPIYHAEKAGVSLEPTTETSSFSGFSIRLRTNDLNHIHPKDVQLPFVGTVTRVSVTNIGNNYYINDIEVKDASYLSSIGNLRADQAVALPNHLISVDGLVLLKCYFDDDIHNLGDDGAIKIFGVFTTAPLRQVANQRSCNLL